MMKILFIAVSIFSVFDVAAGMSLQLPKIGLPSFGYGTCPKISPKADFDMTRFYGQWYEQERLPYSMLANQKCVIYDIANNDDFTYEVTVNMTNTWLGYKTSIVGNLKPDSDDSNPAIMVWKFWKWQYGTIPFVVVDTDYTKYALIYSCSEYSYKGYGFHFPSAWILTRASSTIAPKLSRRLKTYLTAAGIDESKFFQTREDCL